jgi:hypothetical protein
MATSLLKPCPFCGSPAYKGEHPHYPGKYLIKCGSYEAGNPRCIFHPSSGPIEDGLLSLYVEAWDKRSDNGD